MRHSSTGIGFVVTGPHCPSRLIDPGETGAGSGGPQVDSSDSQRESVVASAQNTRGAENAEDCGFGAHGIAGTALRTAPTVTNVEDLFKNHVNVLVSTDFFTVPTARLKVLFVFLVLEHRRREVLHFNVTDHPTSAWVAQQMLEAFGDRVAASRYLIRGRDGVYGCEVRLRLESMGIQEVLTAPQSPWQNGYAERLIGSIRRECLNHFVILNAGHLKKTLTEYFRYYHRSRTHLGLAKQCPIEREVMDRGMIVETPELGGLHHRYERIAA